MPLTRTTHWATREFSAFLVASRNKPFAWGSNDCCLFVANAIESFTGIDIAEAFRGKYSDRSSAFAAIKTIAGGAAVEDAAAWCAAKAGLEELKFPLMAQRGDLVIASQAACGEDGEFGSRLAAIVHLNGTDVITMGESGPVRLPHANVVRAWRV